MGPSLPPADVRAEMRRLAQAIFDMRAGWYRDRRPLLQPEGTGHRRTMVVPSRWGHRTVLLLSLALAVIGVALWTRGLEWGLSFLPLSLLFAINGGARRSGYLEYRAAYGAFTDEHDPLAGELAELRETQTAASTFRDAYAVIAGGGFYRPHLLLHRFDPDDADEVVSWVLQKKGPEIAIHHRVAGHVADMWRPAWGSVYLAVGEGVGGGFG